MTDRDKLIEELGECIPVLYEDGYKIAASLIEQAITQLKADGEETKHHYEVMRDYAKQSKELKQQIETLKGELEEAREELELDPTYLSMNRQRQRVIAEKFALQAERDTYRSALVEHINCNEDCENCREAGCVLRDKDHWTNQTKETTQPQLPSEVIEKASLCNSQNNNKTVCDSETAESESQENCEGEKK